MSPRYDETEAGGVGAVHLVGRGTADRRTCRAVRALGGGASCLLRRVGV